MGTGQEPITVFIVDDNPEIREALRQLLEMENDFRVIGEAGGGEDALHVIVPALAPDVILMDIQMPGLNGLETTRRLREAGCRSNVVVFTEFREYLTPAIAIGADAAISKLESMETGVLANWIRLLIRPTQTAAPTNVGAPDLASTITLLVDDEPAADTLLQRALQKAGFKFWARRA